MCTFAFGLLLLPKELAVAGHLWDHRDRDKERREGSGDAPSARGTWDPSQLSRSARGCCTMTLPLRSMWFSHAWLEGQPDTISRRHKAGAGGTSRSAMLSLGWGGARKSTRIQLHGEGGVCPRQEGLQWGFLMNWHDLRCPYSTRCFGQEQSSCADEQQIFTTRGTEPTDVTQMWGCLQSLLGRDFSFYGSFLFGAAYGHCTGTKGAAKGNINTTHHLRPERLWVTQTKSLKRWTNTCWERLFQAWLGFRLVAELYV